MGPVSLVSYGILSTDVIVFVFRQASLPTPLPEMSPFPLVVSPSSVRTPRITQQSHPAVSPPPSSVISQDSTFFTRKPTGEPVRGGWTLSTIASAPPPPTTTAPTSAAMLAGSTASSAPTTNATTQPQSQPHRPSTTVPSLPDASPSRTLRTRGVDGDGDGGIGSSLEGSKGNVPPPSSPPRPPKGPSAGTVAAAVAAVAAVGAAGTSTPARQPRTKKHAGHHPSPATTVVLSSADSSDDGVASDEDERGDGSGGDGGRSGGDDADGSGDAGAGEARSGITVASAMAGTITWKRDGKQRTVYDCFLFCVPTNGSSFWPSFAWYMLW